jgi:hypothetical protein
VAYFAGADAPRLCPHPGGTVNPSSGKLAGMASHTHRPVRLAEKADETAFRGADLLTAEEAAVLLRVARKFVYAHAPALGGWRLLEDRGPWRFSRRELLARRSAVGRAPRTGRGAGGRERTHTLAGAPMLPAEPRREVR